MKCRYSRCDRRIGGISDYCTIHEHKGTFSLGYVEWDEKRWREKQDNLAKMWRQGESDGAKKSLIMDLIIHAHDVYE